MASQPTAIKLGKTTDDDQAMPSRSKHAPCGPPSSLLAKGERSLYHLLSIPCGFRLLQQSSGAAWRQPTPEFHQTCTMQVHNYFHQAMAHTISLTR